MHSLITWENPDLLAPSKKIAVEWFAQYIQESSKEMLQNLLKFCTGCASLNSLFSPQISLSFTSCEKVLPEASACTTTIMIPLGNKGKEAFTHSMNVALNLGCEGYGNL